MKGLKVLYISDYFPPYVVGGSEISTSLIIKFVSKKFKCYVLTSKFQDNCWKSNGATVYPSLTRTDSKEKSLSGIAKHIFNILFLHYKDYYTVKKFIKEQNIDIIHVVPHTHFYLVAVISSIITKKPVVIDIRDFLLTLDATASNKKRWGVTTPRFNLNNLFIPLFNLYDFFNLKLLQILLRRLIKNGNKVKLVALSKFMKEQLVKAGFQKEKIEVIYNIVDMNVLKDGSEKRKNQIVFAGRLEKEKGIWDAIKAFELIGDNELNFIIAGTGTDLESIRNYLKSKTYSNIKLIGKVTNEQVLELYRSSQAIVCPSVWPEPFGRFILESISTKTPCIATNVGGIPEGIKDRKTGILVEPNNPEQLASAIKLLLKDQKLYQKIQSNLEKEKFRFSPEVIGRQRLKLYKSLLRN